MKKIFKVIIIQIISFIILFGAITFAALVWPDIKPDGEESDGKFIEYFDNMQGTCLDGKVVGGFTNDMIKNCITD